MSAPPEKPNGSLEVKTRISLLVVLTVIALVAIVIGGFLGSHGGAGPAAAFAIATACVGVLGSLAVRWTK